MEKKELIKGELMELLEIYYNGSFPQMACEYIRSTGMTQKEVEQMLEEVSKGAKFIETTLGVSE